LSFEKVKLKSTVVCFIFQLTDSNDTFARSGNPGYLIGKPLLYGTLNVTVSADGVESYPFFTF
jgi:hypothetical protein